MKLHSSLVLAIGNFSSQSLTQLRRYPGISIAVTRQSGIDVMKRQVTRKQSTRYRCSKTLSVSLVTIAEAFSIRKSRILGLQNIENIISQPIIPAIAPRAYKRFIKILSGGSGCLMVQLNHPTAGGMFQGKEG